ncbi:hypothetical protein GCM10014715_27020 [Streptomyces spiralis]|uniref:Uncharacterized protein n=1 Tax=Streptomyces spiralis TaxID=66376 RepID=A0A918ZUP0_9ACTN|nr:hypothetical protein GCM10014715_27020 [Streptomyces spiralis]
MCARADAGGVVAHSRALRLRVRPGGAANDGTALATADVTLQGGIAASSKTTRRFI